VSPYIIVVDAGAALDLYAPAFGAVETSPRRTAADGSIVQTEIRIGSATVMMAEHNPDFGTGEPLSLGGTPVRLALDVESAEATVEAAEGRAPRDSPPSATSSTDTARDASRAPSAAPGSSRNWAANGKSTPCERH